jgi:hypothetical protein
MAYSGNRNGKRWLIPLIGFFILGLIVYVNRERLERLVIAYEIHHVSAFAPPPIHAGESRWHRFCVNTQFYWDVSELRVARERRLREFEPELRPLVREISRREATGENMQYSMHIYTEVRWLLNFTPNIEATQARIADLRQSLAQPLLQNMAGEQQSLDGSWGLGMKTWYLRLYHSVDEVKQCQKQPRYPLSFLDRINSPEKLTAELDSSLLDDFTKTWEFNREQLDETFSALAIILFATKSTACYPFDPSLKDALREFVLHWQNPATGCWGQWLLDREGRIWRMDDVGMTFHVVSDLHGQVPHLDLIAKRVLQLDRAEFPRGILFNGHYENHLNWDAVKIFRYAWPTLDPATREQVRAEISQMLDWCLTKSYQPDGSFKLSDLDDTEGDAYRYGVLFLAETGYFRQQDRFWTSRDFPNAEAVRDRIAAKLQSMGLHDGLKEAYDTLQTAQ